MIVKLNFVERQMIYDSLTRVKDNLELNCEELVKSTDLSSELISYQIKSINNLIKKICGY